MKIMMKVITTRSSGLSILPRLFGLRSLSEIHLGASEADVEDVIERNLDKKHRRKEDISPVRVMTTRREALSLYREIYRLTALFNWTNEHDVPWRDVLRNSARQEFEAARFEQDPEVINRLLVVGRDSVSKIAERFAKRHSDMIQTDPGSWRHPSDGS